MTLIDVALNHKAKFGRCSRVSRTSPVYLGGLDGTPAQWPQLKV